MSNHHTQRAINLHHDQVNNGKARKEQRQADRMLNFLEMRKQLRFKHNFIMVCGFFCFAYIALATAVYLGWLI